jgi:3-hydroxy-3-methylglutaryl CoA synthase
MSAPTLRNGAYMPHNVSAYHPTRHSCRARLTVFAYSCFPSPIPALPLTYARSLSLSRPPLSTTLDAIKFICKDIWASVWDKQVDNLRTNHRVRALSPLLQSSNIG